MLIFAAKAGYTQFQMRNSKEYVYIFYETSKVNIEGQIILNV